MTAADDFLGSVRDPNVKEIIAKELLEYDPQRSANLGAERAALGEMVELGHSVFHKVRMNFSFSVVDPNRLCSDPDSCSHVHSNPDPAPEPNRIRINSDPDPDPTLI